MPARTAVAGGGGDANRRVKGRKQGGGRNKKVSVLYAYFREYMTTLPRKRNAKKEK